jgi:thiamine biosynthesis lipoprotein
LKETRILMGMPVTLEVVDPSATEELFDSIYAYFAYIDEKFSTYQENSEISMINRHELTLEETSQDMKTVLALAEQFRLETNGYFNVISEGLCDPSGVVKGWAISNAAEMIRQKGYTNFYVEAGGDIQAFGKNSQGQHWRVGIRNPFNMHEIVKVLSISELGVATSGTYIRGQHIYNPKNDGQLTTEIVSLTVIGPDICAADSYATAAFAMGTEGIAFIENLDGFEGYMIDKERWATYTSGFMRYVIHD